MIKSIRKIFFILIFFIVNQNVYSQWRLNQISGEEGLSQNTIRSIIQDRNGYIWIGTYNGINKYDGYDMQQYNYDVGSKGLSSNIIVKLFEDKDGFIWAGTTDAGINRINPSTGKVDVFFKNSYTSNYFSEINNIYQSSSGIFFINTQKGIKFFRVTEEGALLFDKEISNIRGFDLDVRNIRKALNGKHWFLTSNRDVRLYQAEITDEYDFPEIAIEKTNLTLNLFSKGYVVDFFEYPKNTIWLVSNRLEVLQVKLNESLKVIEENRFHLLGENPIKTEKTYRKLNMSIDKNDKLWIAGDGILLNIHTSTKEVTNFNKNNQLKDLISKQQAQEILIDNSNILWLGTLNNGLYKIDLDNHTFFNSNEFLPETKKNKFHDYPILSICEDFTGNIWFGTQGEGGLAVLKKEEIQESIENISKGPWSYEYLAEKNSVFKLPAFREVKRLMSDRSGNIWVGSRDGLSKISLNKKSANYQVETLDEITNDSGAIINNPVFALEEDSFGNLWVGYWNNGLVKINFNKNTNSYSNTYFAPEDHNNNSLSNNYIRDIMEDEDGNIWVGTIGGLNKLENPQDRKPIFHNFFNDPNDINSLSNNYILDIFQSKNGTFYAGTFGGGLNSFKADSTGKLNFKHYRETDGLPSDVIYQIKEDEDGNIWMLHVREISKLNPITGEITYFEKQDGFNVNEFKDNAMTLTSFGAILCGGVNGFTFFNPDNLSVNTNKPHLTITGFKLFNESIIPNQTFNKHIILTKSIDKTKEIVLPYNLNSFEFDFSSMHFSNPEKNKYRYILEGFNDKWQGSTGNIRRFASYTNVPPGNYTFKVNGSNSAGIWDDTPIEIAIIIEHPWYLKTWAIILFSILGLGLVILVIRIRSNQIRLKSELEFESALHEKSEEINKMKLQFFTNISHELRTPLTLIIGPLQQIMKGNSNPEYLHKLNIIMYKNSVRLLKLINQLLDFRKAESGSINLIVQKGDLVSFVREIYTAFEEISIEKNIQFNFSSKKKKIDAWFDNDKIEKILYNLLSNAFKFTSSGQKIDIRIAVTKNKTFPKAIITVSDEGMGIPENELQSIFERFYQAKKEESSIHIGSGLGLAYTKHLVEIHKGTIDIDSELEKGTTCSITIPISKNSYENDSIIENLPKNYNFNFTKKEVKDIKEGITLEQNKAKKNTHSDETATLLIVEDNTDLLEYLTSYFENFYHILSADNGEDGLKLAQKHVPNIIISDLMMPKMNGIEMCKKIKNDLATSHVPVIILTAKAGLENEKEGLETGAEEFILKPFNIEILKLRVDNLLKSKKVWEERFKTQPSSESWKDLSSKLDQDFLEKSLSIIKKNIDNPDFSVERFSLDIGISRSTLFKKVKSITGQSTSEFIRTIRLKKAASLIESGKYSITEVVFMVGFSDPKYFRTCFKKQYNQTPSEYLKSFKTIK